MAPSQMVNERRRVTDDHIVFKTIEATCDLPVPYLD